MSAGRHLWRNPGVIVAAFLAASAASCAKERGITPVPERYRLYVSTQQIESRVFIFDLATDSLIDSTAEAIPFATYAMPTPDGKYFFRYAYPKCTEIWDAEVVLKIGDFPGCAPNPMPALGDDLILAGAANRLDYVSYPAFVRLATDTLTLPGNPLIGARFVDESRGVVLCEATFGGGRTDWEEFFTWDYRNRRIVQRYDLRQLLSSERLNVGDYAFDPISNDLIAVAGADPASVIFRLDLDEGALVWKRTGQFSQFSTVRLTPAGNEIWGGYRGNAFFAANKNPNIHILDPATGGLLDTVSLRGVLDDSTFFPSIQDIVFTPDGATAYAATGVNYSVEESGPVLVIDVATRRLIRYLLDGEHHPFQVEIGPSP